MKCHVSLHILIDGEELFFSQSLTLYFSLTLLFCVTYVSLLFRDLLLQTHAATRTYVSATLFFERSNERITPFKKQCRRPLGPMSLISFAIVSINRDPQNNRYQSIDVWANHPLDSVAAKQRTASKTSTSTRTHVRLAG